MKQIKTIAELKNTLAEIRKQNLSVGLVPTMGALHEGHLSLLRQSVHDNDVSVVSIFLNPTQFNNEEDYKKYPRNIAADLSLLEAEKSDIVFTPSVDEMYPEGDVPERFDLGRVAEVMEGRYRPGHFKGVAQIVSKLFKIIEPDRAYFGEKDFQQIAVIQKLLTQISSLKIDIISCPVIRDDNGLALSSRNSRLSEEEKEMAPIIYKTLCKAVEWSKEGKSVDEVRKEVIEEINKTKHLNVEYFSIVNAFTLEEVHSWSEAPQTVGCITVYCGKVRLIDHIHFPSKYTTSK